MLIPSYIVSIRRPYETLIFLGGVTSAEAPLNSHDPMSWGFAERRSWPMELLINLCIASFLVLFAVTLYVTWLTFFSHFCYLERWPWFHMISPSLVDPWWSFFPPSFRTDATDCHKGNYSFCGGKSWNERCGASHPGGWDRCSLTLELVGI